MAICKGDSLFGDRGKYIKFLNGDIVAVDGMNIFERLLTNDLRMPYKQLLKSRVVLKPGQVDYLLNHLGMGDNATFLAIRAKYNQKSVNEEDNYILWNYFDDFSKKYAMGQVMILTGNSTNRIKQLYLTNPNDKYSVELDIMVASIDDEYNFFPDTRTVGFVYSNILFESFKNNVTGQSIKVVDIDDLPIIYINIADIIGFERQGNIILLYSSVAGTITFIHTTDLEAAQTESMLSLLLQNTNINIDLLGRDETPPVIYFEEGVQLFGVTGSTASVDTTMGLTFSLEIESADIPGGFPILKDPLANYIIDKIEDNRDGIIGFDGESITIRKNNATFDNIYATGSYDITFNVSDIALNNLSDVILYLTVN
jgi:hypothetical protein